MLGCTEKQPTASGNQGKPNVPASATQPLATPANGSGGENAADTPATKHHSDGIAWFGGTVDEAFATAKSEGRPLFFYWGAIWCPPCEQVKQTVFKSPDFIAQSRLFIPVYLDGDTERAQRVGEQYAVMGYPTMIVFNAAGEELTRIPGGIDIDQYNRVLASSLERLRSTADLYQAAFQAPQQLTVDDYTQLAFYSWWQTNLPASLDVSGDKLIQLSESAKQAGNATAASRLLLQGLVMHYEQEQTLNADQAEQARHAIAKLLADKQLVLTNLDLLMFWSEELVGLVSDPGADKSRLMQKWVSAMRSVRYEQSLSGAEQVGTWYPELYFYWIENPEDQTLPQTELTELREHVRSLDEATHGSARQAVINRSYQVLEAAHLVDDAKAMLLAETEKSQQPYYFMSSLAELEQDQGNLAQAVDWLQKAYNAAHGQATRFQWGVEYVAGTIEMQPNQRQRIDTALASLIGNLDAPKDVYNGRNFKRLKTLLAALDGWAEKTNSAAVDEFYATLQRACKDAGLRTPEGQNCAALELPQA